MLTAPFSGLFSRDFECRRWWSISCANSTLGCDRAYDWMRVKILEWFEVSHSLREECVLAPMLFNVFFTAVLNNIGRRCDPVDIHDMEYPIRR